MRLLSLARDSTGETLLGAAAKQGEAFAVQVLLSHRADPIAHDSRGRMALHRAAESGDLLSTLMVLDRLQIANRHVNVTDFLDNAGETPGTLAAQNGASAVCSALELFGDLQLNAEQQYFGQLGVSGAFGGLLSLVDFTSESSKERRDAREILEESSVGGHLVREIWQAADPYDEVSLEDLLGKAFDALHEAEELLMTTSWMPSIFCTLAAEWKGFAKTVDLRVRWQKTRREAMKSLEVEDFWQTHLSTKRLEQLTRTPGSLRQLYLGVLWLYTRESWLPHVVDAMAAALRSLKEVEDAKDASNAPFPFHELIKLLSPMVQLVQAATCFFRRSGIRHEGVTFRPLIVPASGLQQLIDMYLGKKDECEKAAISQSGMEEERLSLHTGIWFVMSRGSFPTAYASRWDAGKRLVQTNSNVLLAIQTDGKSPSYPEHMSLKGGCDDVIYPVGTLFRLVRLARTTSSLGLLTVSSCFVFLNN